MSALQAAQSVYEWARRNGFLSESPGTPTGEPLPLSRITSDDDSDVDPQYAHTRLGTARIVGTVADEDHNKIYILTRNRLGPRITKTFPRSIEGCAVAYVGNASLEANPPIPPQASSLPYPPCHMWGNAFACGSSITAAPVPGAGTLGALVRDQNNNIFGLTNNHVTGDCNHTRPGMYIMAPSPVDADPAGPAPTAIGRHHLLVPLQSGDPQQIRLQELDVATFHISDPRSVSSMQGSSSYRFDTPSTPSMPSGGIRVKKIGRTSGPTAGTVLGQFANTLPIPYQSANFRSRVYFANVWAVKGDHGEPFSQGGDSGSLVVTEDGNEAVGLVFAGHDSVSAIIPLPSVLNHLGVTLVTGHNV